MTFGQDFTVKCQDDYELWDSWLRFLGLHEKKPLTELLRHIYAVGMTMPQAEPFVGNSMQELIKELNRREFQGKPYTIDSPTFSSYKKKMKYAGWLNADGTLKKSIADMRKVYKEDAEKGVRSISLIYKLCVC